MWSYRALGFDSSKEEMKEILEVLDPENEGFVTYGMFLEVAALKMKSKFIFVLQIIVVANMTTDRDQKLEVQRAFDLFKGGTGDDSPITMADLRRVADELKENVTDQQLRDMLDEACSKEVGRGVNL
jgi:Ca2+-binding EF-hand superfamily protein